jgi:HNH endonuclease
MRSPIRTWRDRFKISQDIRALHGCGSSFALFSSGGHPKSCVAAFLTAFESDTGFLMHFPAKVQEDAMVASQRHCCLCHRLKHTKMQCHHIVPHADGGEDTFDNCIPLCLECHGEVEAYNSKHPIGDEVHPYRAETSTQRVVSSAQESHCNRSQSEALQYRPRNGEAPLPSLFAKNDEDVLL